MEYDKLREAIKVLGIKDKASIKEIKEIYKDLMAKYHPDKCKQEECYEKSQIIAEAYKIIMDYCENYKIDFTSIDLKDVDKQRWWYERFGDDPIWGKPR